MAPTQSEGWTLPLPPSCRNSLPLLSLNFSPSMPLHVGRGARIERRERRGATLCGRQRSSGEQPQTVILPSCRCRAYAPHHDGTHGSVLNRCWAHACENRGPQGCKEYPEVAVKGAAFVYSTRPRNTTKRQIGQNQEWLQKEGVFDQIVVMLNRQWACGAQNAFTLMMGCTSSL
jgi:hypothetical protein